MRTLIRSTWALLASAILIAPATALGQNTNPNAPPNPRPGADDRAGAPAPAVIGSHQIDRYEAIKQLQQTLKDKPDNALDWVILGELAHEVAMDLPPDQAANYYRMSREAYEKALRLEPDNAGLKAAAQFARDQESNANQFSDRRRQAVGTYLDARRREMAQSGPNPTVEVYSTPVAPSATAGNQVVQPAPVAGQPGVAATTVMPAQAYPYAVYQPFAPTQGSPYTYQQYSNAYAPGTWAGQPTTMRQYAQQLPQVLMNQATRGALGQPAAVPRPR